MGGASSASRFADRGRSRRALACNALLSNEDGVFVTTEGGAPIVDGGSTSDSFAPISGCEKTLSEDPSAPVATMITVGDAGAKGPGAPPVTDGVVGASAPILEVMP